MDTRCVKCGSHIHASHGRWFAPPPPGTKWAPGAVPYSKCQGCGPFTPNETKNLHLRLRAAQRAAFSAPAPSPVIASRGGCNCVGSR